MALRLSVGGGFRWASVISVTLTALVPGLTLALAGCGDGSSAALSSKPPSQRPTVPQGAPSPTLIVKDIKVGGGAVARKGHEVAVRYVGGVYETGEEIESDWSADSSEAYGFQLGEGYAFPGWEKGIPGMCVGGRRELIFPTTVGHVPVGSRLGDTLVYVIDLVAVR